jgi:enoyl-CoA hydratase/carnithine racemase
MPLQCTRVDGVLRLTIDEVPAKNALKPDTLNQMRSELMAAEKDQELRVAVIRGAGDTFCSGYDLSSLDTSPHEAHQLLDATLTALERSRLVSIACVDGACVGAGFEVAASCDVRVVASRARFCLPAARIGVVYPFSGMRRIVRAVGLSWARYLAISGEFTDALAAQRIGLAHVVCDASELNAEADRIASRIASERAPLSIQGTKHALQILESEATTNEDELLRLDQLATRALDSADLAEGRRAQRERRVPRFTGA